MGGFSVDTDAVKTFSQRISQVCADLASAAAPSELSDGEAGNRDVGQALRDFHAHWKQQQDKVLDSLATLSHAIADAAKGYAESDTVIASAAEEGK